MNRANQAALYQETNQGLLNIRQAEINYYTNLNLAFGTQAALIGGFTYGVFTQNQANDDTAYASLFQDIYWVTSAGTIAASVHVILTTMLLQVLGPGLALHGPIGSMARACEGMRKEQKASVTAFVFMIVLFSISTILSFWAVMSLEAASGATAVWLIAARYYYFYCERIYLRFHWKEESDYWRRSADMTDDPAGADYEPPASVQTPVNPVHGLQHHHHVLPPGVSSRNSSVDAVPRINSFTPFAPTVVDLPRVASHDPAFRAQSTGDGSSIGGISTVQAGKTGKTGKTKLFSTAWFKGKGGAHSSDPLQQQLLQNPTAATAGGPDAAFLAQHMAMAQQNPRAVAMEGFLMIQRGDKPVSSTASTVSTTIQLTTSTGSSRWDRRYLTLSYSGHIFVYASRMAYRENTRNPVYRRPLYLQDYVIWAFNSEEHSGLSYQAEEGESVPRTVSVQPGRVLFQWVFVPLEASQQSSDEDSSDSESVAGTSSLVQKKKKTTGASSSAGAAGAGTATKGSRREWVLRSDTAEEWRLWSEIFQLLAPEALRIPSAHSSAISSVSASPHTSTK